MTVVLDASAVVDWCLRTGRGQRIDAWIQERAAPLLAPELLDIEVLQALRRHQQQGVLSAKEAKHRVAALFALPARRVTMRPLLPRIWLLRGRLTAYDASYVALAEACGGQLLTTDERLARSLPRSVRRLRL